MRRFLLPIVEDDICAMQRGMGLSETWHLARGRGSAKSTGEWDGHIVQTAHRLNVRKSVSGRPSDSPSDDDLHVIKQVWDDYGAMTNSCTTSTTSCRNGSNTGTPRAARAFP